MKKEGFDFFRIVHVSISHVTKGLQMRILTVCSVIVRCICWAMSAEAILSICQMVLKNCSNCTLPHCREGYAHVMNKYLLIAERIRKSQNVWRPDYFQFFCETNMKSLCFSMEEHRFFFLCICCDKK